MLETEHLHLRKFEEQDAEFIFRLLNSPGWLEFIGNRNIKTLEDARYYIINGPMYSYNKFGFGSYLVQLKNTLTSIGMCSLLKRDTLDYVDIGFAFLPEYIGKGLAYEAASATLNYAKKQFGINTMAAITIEKNISSIRLIEKLGFTFEKKIIFPGEEEELLLFSNSDAITL
jgi:RimJ/RimL family protein N-acetyltransferase